MCGVFERMGLPNAPALRIGDKDKRTLHEWTRSSGKFSTDPELSAGGERVPSEQGRYHDLYTQFAAAARGEAEQPVPARQALRTLVVLDVTRLSAQQGRTVELDEGEAAI